jgi:membrane associated rhomboid family serine protease
MAPPLRAAGEADTLPGSQGAASVYLRQDQERHGRGRFRAPPIRFGLRVAGQGRHLDVMLQTLPPERRLREPIFNIPAVVVVSIGLVFAAHALRSVLSDETDLRLLLDLAFVPAQWTIAWNPAKFQEILRRIGEGGSQPDAALRLALAQYVLRGEPRYWTVLTYALLHGSWAHVLLNSLWLAAFGTPVARRCGWLRFAVLALAAALGGAAAHWLGNPDSVMPMVGASAAVSGMMAAAARFIFGGGQHGWTGRHDQPRLSLLGLLANPRAALFIGIWFVVNLLFGIVATPLGITDASIAWEAHIGGFLVGLLLFPLVDRLGAVRSRPT